MPKVFIKLLICSKVRTLIVICILSIKSFLHLFLSLQTCIILEHPKAASTNYSSKSFQATRNLVSKYDFASKFAFCNSNPQTSRLKFFRCSLQLHLFTRNSIFILGISDQSRPRDSARNYALTLAGEKRCIQNLKFNRRNRRTRNA